MWNRLPRTVRSAPRFAAWLVAGLVLVGATGCVHNNHLVFGATEKWTASDVHIVPKTLGTLVVAPFDAVLAPWFMIVDQGFRSEQYDPDHKYFSYAGSRTVGRAGMGWGYEIIASVFSIPIDTIYLLVTGPIDLIWVLGFEDVPAVE